MCMSKAEDAYMIRSKIWIEDGGGHVVFGLGRYRILEAIDRLGSFQAAARELKMSYRAVWCRIRLSEERMGRHLVVREKRGSCLTPFARRMMKEFKRMRKLIESESDDVYERLIADMLPSDAQESS